MTLSTEQIDLIFFIDQKVRNIISNGGNEISIMISMLDEMPRIKTLIIDSADEEELNKYYDSHEGFYQYMKILENTADAIANGSLQVPK